MPSTIRDLTELTAVAADDYLLISDTSDVTNRDKRISTTNLQLTLPKKTGTPVAGRVAGWTDANTINDGGIVLTDIARLSVAQTFTAGVTAAAFNTTVPTIATDTVFAYTPLGGNNSGLLFVGANNDSTCGAIISWRAASGAYCVSLSLGSNVNVTTGVLTGTTGVSGKVTISTFTDGKIYIENRRPSALIFKVLLVA